MDVWGVTGRAECHGRLPQLDPRLLFRELHRSGAEAGEQRRRVHHSGTDTWRCLVSWIHENRFWELFFIFFKKKKINFFFSPAWSAEYSSSPVCYGRHLLSFFSQFFLFFFMGGAFPIWGEQVSYLAMFLYIAFTLGDYRPRSAPLVVIQGTMKTPQNEYPPNNPSKVIGANKYEIRIVSMPRIALFSLCLAAHTCTKTRTSTFENFNIHILIIILRLLTCPDMPIRAMPIPTSYAVYCYKRNTTSL